MRKRAFLAICETNSVAYRFEDATKTAHVDPPAGHVFSNTGLHFMTQAVDGPWRLSDIYADMADDIRGGTEPCDRVDCDTCGGGE